jgi:hypothetical protein
MSQTVEEAPAWRAPVQGLLEELLGSDQVWFQEPGTQEMQYPCIVYDLEDVDVTRADNIAYLKAQRWLVTVMDWDPDSPIAQKLIDLPMCSVSRFYAADNLNHFAFVLYF